MNVLEKLCQECQQLHIQYSDGNTTLRVDIEIMRLNPQQDLGKAITQAEFRVYMLELTQGILNYAKERAL